MRGVVFAGGGPAAGGLLWRPGATSVSDKLVVGGFQPPLRAGVRCCAERDAGGAGGPPSSSSREGGGAPSGERGGVKRKVKARRGIEDKLETIVFAPASPRRKGEREGRGGKLNRPSSVAGEQQQQQQQQQYPPSPPPPQEWSSSSSSSSSSSGGGDNRGGGGAAGGLGAPPTASLGSMYDSLLHSSRQHDWEECLGLILYMKEQGIKVDASACRALANSLSQPKATRTGAEDAAKVIRKILSTLEKAGISPDVTLLEVAISRFARLGSLEETQHVFAKARELDIKLTEVMYKELAVAESRKGRWRAAKALHTEMIEELGIFPDTTMSNALLMAMGKSLQWRNALHHLQAMRKARDNGIREASWPNEVSYGHVITACGRAGEWARALETLNTQAEDGVPLSIIGINSAMSACQRAQQWRACMDLFERAIQTPGVEPDVITFNTAISALGKGNQVGMAIQLLNDMKAHGIKPDRISYNSAMAACARIATPNNDAYNRCISLKQAMQRAGIRPDKFTYATAISACAKAHQTSEALTLLEVMQANGEIPDVVTYTSTIDACAATGKWEEAVRLVDEMTDRGVEPNERTFRALIAACSKSGKWQRALETLKLLRSKGLEVGTAAYNAAMTACLHGKQPQRVAQLFQELQAEASCFPDVASYTTAIAAAGATGDWKMALQLLDDMRNAGPSLSPNVMAFTSAIGAVGRAGQWRIARDLLFDISNQGMSPDTPAYNAVIHACLVAEEVDEALRVLREMEASGHSLDIATLTDLHSALSKTGRKSAARALYNRALESGVIKYSNLDTDWEVDVASLPPELAAVKVQVSLERVLEGKEGHTGEVSKDLVFICGSGVQRSRHGTTTKKFDMKGHVRMVLQEVGLDSRPPSKEESFMNPAFAGCVVISAAKLQEWISRGGGVA